MSHQDPVRAALVNLTNTLDRYCDHAKDVAAALDLARKTILQSANIVCQEGCCKNSCDECGVEKFKDATGTPIADRAAAIHDSEIKAGRGKGAAATIAHLTLIQALFIKAFEVDMETTSIAAIRRGKTDDDVQSYQTTIATVLSEALDVADACAYIDSRLKAH